MFLSAVIINTVSILFPFISMIVYGRLLLCVFCWKTIKQVSELSLFYYKFGLDLAISVISFLKLILYALVMTSLLDFFLVNHWLTFLIIWPINLLTAMRGILLFFIALDRTFATYLPIKFFKYRKYIPTVSILFIVFLYCLIDSCIAFLYCQPTLSKPTTCVNASCVLGSCYQNYSLSFQQVCYFMISILTLLLVIKLFVWNKYRNQTVNNDLKKANRLALIDCCIIIFFDLTPPLLHSAFPNIFDYLGAINSVAQCLGFVVESCLVTVNLQQKYETKTGTMTIVRSSGVKDTSVMN